MQFCQIFVTTDAIKSGDYFAPHILTFLAKKLVWNSTFEVGAGTARSTVHGDIICLRYSPRGAEGGPDMFKKNVFPKVGRSEKS